jgi:hypothetical protein
MLNVLAPNSSMSYSPSGRVKKTCLGVLTMAWVPYCWSDPILRGADHLVSSIGSAVIGHQRTALPPNSSDRPTSTSVGTPSGRQFVTARLRRTTVGAGADQDVTGS